MFPLPYRHSDIPLTEGISNTKEPFQLAWNVLSLK